MRPPVGSPRGWHYEACVVGWIGLQKRAGGGLLPPLGVMQAESGMQMYSSTKRARRRSLQKVQEVQCIDACPARKPNARLCYVKPARCTAQARLAGQEVSSSMLDESLREKQLAANKGQCKQAHQKQMLGGRRAPLCH